MACGAAKVALWMLLVLRAGAVGVDALYGTTLEMGL